MKKLVTSLFIALSFVGLRADAAAEDCFTHDGVGLLWCMKDR